MSGVSGEARVTDAAGAAGGLSSLWVVQQVDARLAERRAERAALDDGSALRAETEAAQQASADAASRLHAAQAALRSHELELATADAKQKKAEGDLYGGRVSNPKELASLAGEIESLTRARDHLADKILDLLEQVEALTREASTREREARALAGRLTAHLGAYEAERTRLDGELAALEADRAARAAAVEPRLLKKYEGIAAQEGGIGMVAILGGFCGGCRNDVPVRFVSRVREGEVVTCERCHRILYLDETA